MYSFYYAIMYEFKLLNVNNLNRKPLYPSKVSGYVMYQQDEHCSVHIVYEGVLISP